ncbi:hypothetical protein KKC60_03360 [Patescibacteria group bacterium]|nr:hypothetical protein [Patescibacteria group bacterium]
MELDAPEMATEYRKKEDAEVLPVEDDGSSTDERYSINGRSRLKSKTPVSNPSFSTEGPAGHKLDTDEFAAVPEDSGKAVTQVVEEKEEPFVVSGPLEQICSEEEQKEGEGEMNGSPKQEEGFEDSEENFFASSSRDGESYDGDHEEPEKPIYWLRWLLATLIVAGVTMATLIHFQKVLGIKGMGTIISISGAVAFLMLVIFYMIELRHSQKALIVITWVTSLGFLSLTGYVVYMAAYLLFFNHSRLWMLFFVGMPCGMLICLRFKQVLAEEESFFNKLGHGFFYLAGVLAAIFLKFNLREGLTVVAFNKALILHLYIPVALVVLFLLVAQNASSEALNKECNSEERGMTSEERGMFFFREAVYLVWPILITVFVMTDLARVNDYSVRALNGLMSPRNQPFMFLALLYLVSLVACAWIYRREARLKRANPHLRSEEDGRRAIERIVVEGERKLAVLGGKIKQLDSLLDSAPGTQSIRPLWRKFAVGLSVSIVPAAIAYVALSFFPLGKTGPLSKKQVTEIAKQSASKVSPRTIAIRVEFARRLDKLRRKSKALEAKMKTLRRDQEATYKELQRLKGYYQNLPRSVRNLTHRRTYGLRAVSPRRRVRPMPKRRPSRRRPTPPPPPRDDGNEGIGQ